MKTSTKMIEGKVDDMLQAWESDCPGQAFADMTLEQCKQELQSYFDARAKFAAANVAWEAARQARNTAYARALELVKSIVNSVKGHPKFGENSAVYTAMGYVPTSQRSSGLTRKRDAATTKSPPSEVS